MHASMCSMNNDLKGVVYYFYFYEKNYFYFYFIYGIKL